MSKITDDGLIWHRMLYSCTHMATVGVKGLISSTDGSNTAEYVTQNQLIKN